MLAYFDCGLLDIPSNAAHWRLGINTETETETETELRCSRHISLNEAALHYELHPNFVHVRIGDYDNVCMYVFTACT